MWPFNTGDCLIEVTVWTGLTVSVLNSITENNKTFSCYLSNGTMLYCIYCVCNSCMFAFFVFICYSCNIVLLTGCFCIGPGIDSRSAVLAQFNNIVYKNYSERCMLASLYRLWIKPFVFDFWLITPRTPEHAPGF